jgi:hypothetical protein
MCQRDPSNRFRDSEGISKRRVHVRASDSNEWPGLFCVPRWWPAGVWRDRVRGRRACSQSPHILGLFCPFSRSLLTLVWSAHALRGSVLPTQQGTSSDQVSFFIPKKKNTDCAFLLAFAPFRLGLASLCSLFPPCFLFTVLGPGQILSSIPLPRRPFPSLSPSLPFSHHGIFLSLASRPLWRVTHLSACLTQGKAGSGMVTGGFTPVRSSPHWPPEFLPKANRHDQ